MAQEQERGWIYLVNVEQSFDNSYLKEQPFCECYDNILYLLIHFHANEGEST
jgi:hypothetical protein